MREFLVEIEYSTINTYRVKAANEDKAKEKALKDYPTADSIEEHEDVRIHACVEVSD